MANTTPALTAPQVDWERVGATLRALRDARGATTAEMAALLGISYSYLSNIEAGRRPLTPALLVKVAHILAVPQLAILRPGLTEEGEA